MSIKKEIIENIAFEDLRAKEQLHEIAHIIGIDAMKKLIELYSGVQIYIPSLLYFDRVVERVIKQDKYKNVSKQKIAKELGINYKTLIKKLSWFNLNLTPAPLK